METMQIDVELSVFQCESPEKGGKNVRCKE